MPGLSLSLVVRRRRPCPAVGLHRGHCSRRNSPEFDEFIPRLTVLLVESGPFAEAAEFADGTQHGEVRGGQQLHGGFQLSNPDVLVRERRGSVGARALRDTASPASVFRLTLLILGKQAAARFAASNRRCRLDGCSRATARAVISSSSASSVSRISRICSSLAEAISLLLVIKYSALRRQ